MNSLHKASASSGLVCRSQHKLSHTVHTAHQPGSFTQPAVFVHLRVTHYIHSKKTGRQETLKVCRLPCAAKSDVCSKCCGSDAEDTTVFGGKTSTGRLTVRDNKWKENVCQKGTYLWNGSEKSAVIFTTNPFIMWFIVLLLIIITTALTASKIKIQKLQSPLSLIWPAGWATCDTDECIDATTSAEKL